MWYLYGISDAATTVVAVFSSEEKAQNYVNKVRPKYFYYGLLSGFHDHKIVKDNIPFNPGWTFKVWLTENIGYSLFPAKRKTNKNASWRRFLGRSCAWDCNDSLSFCCPESNIQSTWTLNIFDFFLVFAIVNVRKKRMNCKMIEILVICSYVLFGFIVMFFVMNDEL